MLPLLKANYGCWLCSPITASFVSSFYFFLGDIYLSSYDDDDDLLMILFSDCDIWFITLKMSMMYGFTGKFQQQTG